MLNTIFANIGHFFYLPLYLITIGTCLYSRARAMYFSALILSLVEWSVWFPMWQYPFDMAIVHAFIMLATLFLGGTIWHDRIESKLAISLLLMVFADISTSICLRWVPVEQAFFQNRQFWWHSVINLIFIYQCVVTMMRSYQHIQAGSRQRNSDDHYWMARTSGKGT